MSQSRFNLVLCEIFNRNIHGASSENIEPVDGHYLLIAKFDGKTRRLLDDVDDLEDIDDYAEFYNDEYYNDTEFAPHIIIQNYQHIVSRPNYIKPEIAECIVLDFYQRRCIRAKSQASGLETVLIYRVYTN